MKLEKRSQLSGSYIDDLHQLYRSEWWTKGREREDIVKMLNGTDHVVAFCDAHTETLVAFSRILTDGIYKALILDVIVSPEYRGKGFGQMLIDAIIEHPVISEVKHLELYCVEDMVTFYENWGFSDELDDLRLMRRY